MAAEDDGVRELEPLLKREPVDVLIPSPLVPQLELSRRISETDSEGQETVPLLSKEGGVEGGRVVHDDPNEGNEGNEGNDSDGGGVGGKIKVEYIENRRARGATFNKRRNGILKKAYELSELTGTVVCAVVFNENRNKLYEYCSVEQPGVVFEKIANYYGYAERRQNNSLKNPNKGYINIPNNESELREAAIAAAHTANIRHDPRRVLGVQQKRNKHNNVKVPAISTIIGGSGTGNEDNNEENENENEIGDNDDEYGNGNGDSFERDHIAGGFEPLQNPISEEDHPDADMLLECLIPGDDDEKAAKENLQHDLSLPLEEPNHDLEDLFAHENLLLQPPIHFGDIDTGDDKGDTGEGDGEEGDGSGNNGSSNRRFDLDSMQVVEMPGLAETAPLKYEVLVFPRTSSGTCNADEDE